MKKRYVIFEGFGPASPCVALIEKENPQSYRVLPADISALPGAGTFAHRVDKMQVIGVISDEKAVVRAISFIRMLSRQHDAVVSASQDAMIEGIIKIHKSLKRMQEAEEQG